MPMIIQDIVVSVVAMAALGVIVWRVIDVARPGKKAPACNGCSTGQSTCSAVPVMPGDDVKPVVFVRPKL